MERTDNTNKSYPTHVKEGNRVINSLSLMSISMSCFCKGVISFYICHTKCWGSGSIVGTVTGYGLEGWDVESRQGQEFSLLQIVQTDSGSHPGSYHMGPQWVKRQGHEADHSPPTSAEVKKTWTYTSTPPCLQGMCLVKHSDNFTFYFILNFMITFIAQHNEDTEQQQMCINFPWI
jgi:hypothetical protein